MSPLHPGDPGEGHGEEGDDGTDEPVGFRPPLPPEDRIWRHPSEVAAARGGPAGPAPVANGIRGARALGLATLCALIGALLSLGGAAALGWFDPEARLVERQVAVQPVTSGADQTDTVAAIATRTAPAIAALRAERDGQPVAGSALAYLSDGHLVTTARFVDGTTSIEVLLHDGASATATVVGVDPVTDVAVLHVESIELEPAALGTAAGLEPGDRTISIGAAVEGGWAPAVVTGVVSALGRRLQTDDGHVLHDVILVDAPVPDGGSGGALVDIHGAVVGLTGTQPSSTEHGAATPIDVVRHVADQIIEHGRARHVWLGVEGTDLPAADAVGMGIAGGAAVNRVLESGPAAAVGLVEGDVIVAVDGRPVDSMSDLISVLRMQEPGDEVVVTVRRGADEVLLQVTLAEKR